MKTFLEPHHMIEKYNDNSLKKIEATPEFTVDKERWIQKYAQRVLKLWVKLQPPLGVDNEYIDQIKKDLLGFYEEPLKKIFIEATY